MTIETNDSARSDAIASMNSDLKKQFNEIKDLFKQRTLNDVDTGYEIGARVLQIKNGRKMYGEQAVFRLATALGLDDSYLYKLSRLPKRFPEKEFVILSRRNQRHTDAPLTISHWLALVAKDKRDQAREWYERAMMEGWTADELKAQRTERSETIRNSSPDAKHVFHQSVERTLRDLKRANPALAELREAATRVPQGKADRGDEQLSLRVEQVLLDLTDAAQRALAEWSSRRGSRNGPSVVRAGRPEGRVMLLAGGVPQDP